ncbi:MAG: hypothetical protein WBB88_08770 [Methyloceanibacter sp.]
MLKQTLIAAAALTALAFGAPQAEAGYGHGNGHGHGHGHGHHNYSKHWNYSNYGGGCYVSRPVTIRVWSDYAYGYIYKTVYRGINICY